MIVISEADIERLTNPLTLTEEMMLAMTTYVDGGFVMPDRMHVDFGENTLLLMPASAGSFFCTKLVSLFPENPKQNLPVILGSVLLNDGKTGNPLALFNGAKLTAVRTAAVSAAGILQTTSSGPCRVGLIGTGVQGLHQVKFACSVREVTQVMIFDSSSDRLPPFAASIEPLLPGVNILVASNSRELVENSDIIIMATNSSVPVIPDDAGLLKNRHFIAIGSYKPDMRELPNSLFQLIDYCLVDADMAILESGDLIDPLQSGLLHQHQIVNLGKVINKSISIDTSRTTLFKGVGMALFDLFAAVHLYRQTVEKGIGQHVSL